MRVRLGFLLASGIVFLCFLIFSYIVHEDLLTQVDFDTTVKLQDNIPRKVDHALSWLSDIGSFEVSLFIMLSLAAYFLFKKKWLFSIFIFGAFGFFHVVEIFGKVFVDHLPPAQFMIRTVDQMQFPQFHIREVNSYPSGHSGRAIFLSFLIALLVFRSKKLTGTQKMLIIGILVLYDVFMLVSRVYLGEHWTSDVIGGALLGLGFSLFASIAL